MAETVYIHGMHGLGDNLHQRAVLRKFMDAGADVWLSSSWVSPYHDLVDRGLKVTRGTTTLRKQTQNAAREARKFHHGHPVGVCRHIQMRYPGPAVRHHGSVLAAMMATAGVSMPGDFRLPVPADWIASAREKLTERAPPNKPLMFYRPLVLRTEWLNDSRNPDPRAYYELFSQIRDQYAVVSVADIVPGREWIVGQQIGADVTFHKGELTFEQMAGLVKLSALTYCSPGFAVILSQAVGTPVVSVFGGYDCAKSFSAGAAFAPYLAIEPKKVCWCFRHGCPCSKDIDMPPALERITAFSNDALTRSAAVAA